MRDLHKIDYNLLPFKNQLEMVQNSARFGFSFLTLEVALSCEPKAENTNYLTEEIEVVRNEYAPDKRVALFDASLEKNGEVYILKGERNLPEAITALQNKLRNSKLIIDSIQRLLASWFADETIGELVTISVANLRS